MQPEPEPSSEDDWDMRIIEECLRRLKASRTFDESMEVATIMMNLRKTSTNTNADFRALVTDVATRAIARAEELKKAAAATPDDLLLRKPWAECDDEERERKKTLLARAAKKGGGALGSGLGASGLSEDEMAAKRAAVARAHAAKHGVLGGGKATKGGADTLARMSSRERRHRLSGGGGGGGGGPHVIAHKRDRAGGAAPPPVHSDYNMRVMQQSEIFREQVQRCKAAKGLFEDPLFAAELTSVWKSAPKGGGRDSSKSCPPIVAWKRPRELARVWGCRPQLFLDGADPGDVEQGSLGNCWFLGALSILASKVGHLRRLAVYSDFDIGLHVFLFFRNRTWIKVVIDDRLPVTRGDRLVFGRCKNPGEFWVPLMEKAYAKLIGSYQAMEGGIESDMLVDLTGGAQKMLSLRESRGTRASQENVWKLLQKFRSRGNLMGCASNGEEPQVARVAPQMGLILNHAYALLDVWEGQRRSGEKIRLLKLRNPWGEGEWKGKWKAGCTQWDTLPRELHQQLGYVNQNDGTFFMTFEDFYLFFEKLYLCKLFPKEWERNKKSVQLKWVARTAGGCSNYPTWVNNPQVQLFVRQKTKLFLCLNQRDALEFGKKREYRSIGMSLHANGVPGRRMLVDDKRNRVPESVGYSGFVNARDRTMELTLEPADKPYVVMPAMFEPGPGCGGKPGWEAAFKVEVCSEHPVELRAVGGDSDWTEKALEGAWSPDRAGGCRNNPSWKDNPTYLLTCRTAQHVAIRISQQWDDGAPAIGCYVLQGGSQIAATSTFRSAEGNVLELDLPESDEPYELLPCTFRANVFSKFLLTVYSTASAGLFDLRPK